MKIIFLGGTETVTGSKFLVETERTRLLVDCGLFQGYKWLRKRNWQPIPMGINKVDAVVLTHAHLDHSGFIPVLFKEGYRGPVYAHQATTELCHIMFADSGRIQEEDAKYLGRHGLSKHENPQPLYDENTGKASMRLFESVAFRQPFQVGDIQVMLQPAGHILGAASVIIEAEGKKVAFSGDIGRPEDIMMYPPEPLPEVDLLLLESTYGDRRHEKTERAEEQLAEVVNECSAGGGVVMIPAFSVGRAQLMQHLLVKLMDEGRIPRQPIFLDSPMAINVSEIYRRHHKLHRLTDHDCQRAFDTVIYTRSVDESKAIASQSGPHIIIAGSGMATGGRILHHFKRWLGDHRATVLFSGHQAGGTRGAKMLQGVESIKLHGEWLPVKARVRSLDGLSGHADYVELTSWLQASKLRPKTPIQLIHGEPDAMESFRDHLHQQTQFDVDIADYQGVYHL
ncbi:MBL fold metallo-hydrolase [Idiomarina sp. OT37-5b]|uniref:MBL fold metallo-hydrolase n=1 Tax=Idiomarina aquatica TaxID=1327752 RepID=A0AA94EE68_9GAMM|nr:MULTISPECIES: MBL fold metallo-hydrolase [Idiomarina]AVJ56209.1 MBL fold metallo-hydrolase [Idiomarina sp. OT37-5b]RUO43273.1 MBL fold metallo-hydrolase [Idiomarina aquatica]